MYKQQLKFQKFVCLLSIAASVVVFLYALGIMTDLYDSLYSTMRNPYNLSETDVDGSLVFYYMQNFNQLFLKFAIGVILASCLLYITNTHSRRKYYIGNYFAVAVNVAANAALAWWSHFEILFYRDLFLQVDFDALKAHAERWNTTYTESTFWFDIHYAVFALSLAASALLIVNVLWKLFVMGRETALIRKGRRAAA